MLNMYMYMYVHVCALHVLLYIHVVYCTVFVCPTHQIMRRCIWCQGSHTCTARDGRHLSVYCCTGCEYRGLHGDHQAVLTSPEGSVVKEGNGRGIMGCEGVRERGREGGRERGREGGEEERSEERLRERERGRTGEREKERGEVRREGNHTSWLEESIVLLRRGGLVGAVTL